MTSMPTVTDGFLGVIMLDIRLPRPAVATGYRGSTYSAAEPVSSERQRCPLGATHRGCGAGQSSSTRRAG
jgi:hypothetical protein